MSYVMHGKSPILTTMRSFYDSSLWESRKLEGADSLKKMIREGVNNTSAICVLIGSETWSRRWVKYEIARAIIDGRGLLAVHLNSIKHHALRIPHSLGTNPLDLIAVGKVQHSLLSQPSYYLFEWKRDGWVRYTDHLTTVALPPWLADPAPGMVMPLSHSTNEYDFVLHDGHKNIGTWIDCAAQKAGR